MENIMLINKWKQEKVLGGLDCFVDKNGQVTLLNSSSITIDKKKTYHCFPICDTTIESLSKYDDDIWYDYDVFTNKIKRDNGDVIFGGEGEMGNEGFIVCVDKHKDLIWSLFFINSNPFYKLDIVNNEIHAFSSYDLLYKIKLEDPRVIQIEEKEWR